MKTLRVLVATSCLLCFSGVTRAATIGFQFSGTTAFPSQLFGQTFPALTPYSGHAIYDSESPATHAPVGCIDCSGYQQDRSNGLFLRVGDLTLRADSYVVSAVNDRPGRGGLPEDFLVFDNNGEWDPLLPSGLFINGEPAEGGSLRLNLNAAPTLLSDDQLPGNPAAGSFLISFSGVTASTDGGPSQTDFFGLLTLLKRFEVTPGDYDQDGAVTASDYVIWKSWYGASADLASDGNGDGRIDAADYTVWRDRAAASSSKAIPEPSAIGCVILALVAGAATCQEPRVPRF